MLNWFARGMNFAPFQGGKASGSLSKLFWAMPGTFNNKLGKFKNE
jgi:hypothetical protein